MFFKPGVKLFSGADTQVMITALLVLIIRPDLNHVANVDDEISSVCFDVVPDFSSSLPSQDLKAGLTILQKHSYRASVSVVAYSQRT